MSKRPPRTAEGVLPAALLDDLRPHRVEELAFGLVGALVGVGAEEVALDLDYPAAQGTVQTALIWRIILSGILRSYFAEIVPHHGLALRLVDHHEGGA